VSELNKPDDEKFWWEFSLVPGIFENKEWLE